MFTAFPYYPGWHIEDNYRGKLFLKENYKGTVMRRSYVYVPENVTTKARILREFSFIISSFVNLLFSGRLDVLIVVSPPLGLGLVAYIISILLQNWLITLFGSLGLVVVIMIGAVIVTFFTTIMSRIEGVFKR